MASLSSPLPIRSGRNASSPPTSGGFYKFPKSSRSFTKDTSKTELPSLVLLLDKPDKDFRSEVQRIAKIKTPARKDFKYFHKFEALAAATTNETTNVKIEEISPTKSLPLLNSFSSHSCFLGVDNRKSVEIQTEPPPLHRKEFVDLKDFRNWGTNAIDPFVKELRKVLMTHKPESIEAYVMAYCQARLRGEATPETEEPVKASAQSKKNPNRNTVTPATSLIKIRATKASKSSEVQYREDGEGGSDTEADAEHEKEKIAFEYNSMSSEESASDAGTEQSF